MKLARWFMNFLLDNRFFKSGSQAQEDLLSLVCKWVGFNIKTDSIIAPQGTIQEWVPLAVTTSILLYTKPHCIGLKLIKAVNVGNELNLQYLKIQT